MKTIVKIVPYRRTPKKLIGIVEDVNGLAFDFTKLTLEKWNRCPIYYTATIDELSRGGIHNMRKVILLDEVWADFGDYLEGMVIDEDDGWFTSPASFFRGLVAQSGSAPDS